MNVTEWLKVLSEPARVTPKPQIVKKMLGAYELVTEEDVSRHELYSAAFVNLRERVWNPKRFYTGLIESNPWRAK